MRLNHVALTVTDRDASAAFYARHFGLTERVHEDRHLLILAGSDGSLLALSEGIVPTPPPRTTHFGFQVENRNTVHQAREAFKAEGVGEAEWQEHGPTRVQIFDPDGYRVEIYAF
ncbi:MAG: VOC family protein [Pseudomonadota bacterium]